MTLALTRRQFVLAGSAAMAVLALTPMAGAEDWALDGYDPVLLRREGRAVAGSSAIYTHWRGQVWHFASEDSRASFEANPRLYAPGFDGLCPIALEEGRPNPGNPHYVVIIGERVYLTRSEAARNRLLADPRSVLMAAKASWLRLAH